MTDRTLSAEVRAESVWFHVRMDDLFEPIAEPGLMNVPLPLLWGLAVPPH